MKLFCFFTILLFILAPTHSSHAQGNCKDPAGCSIVSFAAFQNTVGVIQFGNSTGKVFVKKKRVLCSGASCSQLFTMAAALVAPLPSPTGFATVIASGVEPSQVQILVQTREINRDDTRLLGINFVDFLNGSDPTDVPSKANLDSGYPDFKGAGDNGVMHVAPGQGDRLKIVHQVLDPSTEDQLIRPSTLRPSSKPLSSATVDRDLTLQLSAEVLDDLNVRLVIQPINDKRKKDGPAEVFGIPPLLTDSDRETISSITTTPILKNIPFLGYLFSHKKLIETKNMKELAIFITPVIVSSSFRADSPETLTLGPSIQLTKFKNTTIGNTEFFQTLAIDPQGRFLVYADYSQKCKKNILKFVALDSSLLFSSTPDSARILKTKPKVLAGCGDFKNSSTGAYGIDVVNLQ